MTGWRVHAAAWLRAKAEAQERVNRDCPRHVEAYPSWEMRARQLRWDAEELETGQPWGSAAGDGAVLAALEVTEPERNELERLRALINTPQTADWMQAVDAEAAHQQERWGSRHDAGKAPEDWFWLLGYLGGKALSAFKAGQVEKGLHHIVSTSAALLNWHRAATGKNTGMRPGIEPPAQ